MDRTFIIRGVLFFLIVIQTLHRKKHLNEKLKDQARQ